MFVRAQDIINEMFYVLGIRSIASNEVPTANESTSALSTLNQMLGTWSMDNLMVQALTRETFSLVSGQSIYTIGPSKNFNTSVPLSINNSFYTDETNYDYYINIIELTEYDNYGDKNITTGPPVALCYDPMALKQSSRYGRIFLYPIPDKGTYTLTIESQKDLAEFSSTASLYQFPQHYQEALVYNGAIRLAMKYGIQPNQDIIAIAQATYRAINSLNIKRQASMLDIPLSTLKGGRGNIYTWQ